jgi:hypothetical protein
MPMRRALRVSLFTIFLGLAGACTLTRDVDKHSKDYIDPRSCPTPGAKFCDGACKPTDDPALGCAEPGCAPCDPFGHAGAACSAEGKCIIGACETGYADCNKDPVDGCEAKLDSDGAHCGRCGRSCGGGTCTAGACAPIVLASGQASPGEIAIDDTTVYFSNYGAGNTMGAVMRVPKEGGAAGPVASNQDKAWGVAVFGSEVFFSTFATPHFVGRAPRDGSGAGAPTRISGDPGTVRGVAADADFAFFCNYGSNVVGRWRRQNGTIDTFAANMPNDVVVEGADVFWTNDGSNNIVKLPKNANAGTAPSVLASSQNNPRGITADATHVYWVNTGASAGSDGAVMRVARGGGTPETLASGLKFPRELAIDETHVYWATSADGMIQRTTKTPGSAAETLATGQTSPLGVAVDAKYIYWLNFGAGGSVLKLAKP